MPLKIDLLQLWRFRGFIIESVSREFYGRYRHSLFGATWTILNPLSMIAIYTLVFSQVMRTKLPGVDSAFAYSIFLMAGLIPWGLFAEIISRSQNMFLENANLIKKVNFPKTCLPVIVMLGSLMNFGITLGLFILVAGILGILPNISWLAVFPLVIVETILAISIGLILGVANVFFRDAGQLTGIFLQFCFWLTPIIYVVDIIPVPYRDWVQLNPLAPLFAAFQTVFVQGVDPNWSSLLPTTVTACLFSVCAIMLYRRCASDMVDEL